MKLSDLNQDEIEYVGNQSSQIGAGPKKLKLSELHPNEIEDLSKPSQLEAVARGAGQGATLGFLDELSGVAGAIGDKLGRMGVDKIETRNPETQAKIDAMAAEEPSFMDKYRETRDEERKANQVVADEYPKTAFASELVGAIANPLGAISKGLKGAIGAGAAYGLGQGKSDLTEGDIKGAALDTGLGGAGGSVGYAAGKAIPKVLQGVKGLGKKALTVFGPSDEAIAARLAGKAQPGSPGYAHLSEKMGGTLKKLQSQISEATGKANATLSSQPSMPRAYVTSTIDDALSKLKVGETYIGKVDKSIASFLDDFGKDLNNLGAEISQQDLKKLVSKLDDNINWGDQSQNKLNNVLKGIRNQFDKQLKFQNPAYKEAIAPVNVQMKILDNVRKQFNLTNVPGEGLVPTDTTASKLRSALSENKFQTQKNLGLLERKTGDNYLDAVKDHRLSRQFEVPVGPTEKSTRRTMAGAGAGALAGSLLIPGVGPFIGGSIGAGAGSMADRYGGKMVGSLLDKVVQARQSQAFGKFAPAIEAAAKRGPEALAITGTLLSRDPQFRKALDQFLGKTP